MIMCGINFGEVNKKNLRRFLIVFPRLPVVGEMNIMHWRKIISHFSMNFNHLILLGIADRAAEPLLSLWELSADTVPRVMLSIRDVAIGGMGRAGVEVSSGYASLRSSMSSLNGRGGQGWRTSDFINNFFFCS